MILGDYGTRNVLSSGCNYNLTPEKWTQRLKEKIIGRIVSLLAVKQVLHKMKTQPVPIANNGPVKVAVGSSFQDIVTDSGRDAFIEFYAPWCQHCQRFESTWEQLGEKMKNEAVDIIKIDATANDWPESRYAVFSYPTIYWKSADNKKKPIQYMNRLTLNELITFAAKHATAELKGWDRYGKPKKMKA